MIYPRRMIEEASTENLFADPRHSYMRLLLETISDVGAPNRDRQVMGGEPPSPLNPPSGCAFHPRCPLAQDVCRTRAPNYSARSGAGKVACHFVDATPRSQL